jgi:hypothetical protein
MYAFLGRVWFTLRSCMHRQRLHVTVYSGWLLERHARRIACVPELVFFLFECVMLAFQLPCSSLAAGAPIEAVCTHDLGVF